MLKCGNIFYFCCDTITSQPYPVPPVTNARNNSDVFVLLVWFYCLKQKFDHFICDFTYVYHDSCDIFNAVLIRIFWPLGGSGELSKHIH